MKRCLIILILSLIVTRSYSQSAPIDSLDHLISKASSDTARINLEIKKAKMLSEINIDSSLIFFPKIIAAAQKVNYKKGEANALVSMAGSLSSKGNYALAYQKLQNAEILFGSLKDSLILANIYAGYGTMYGMQAKYDTSIQYYEKSIGIDERLGNKEVLSVSYGNLAIGYQMQSNFPQALLYQQKSLRIAEEQKNVSSQAYTLLNMGNTYQKIGDTLKSEEAILKGIELAKSVGIKNVELYGYSNLATLYNFLNKWDKSYAFAMQAATLAKTIGDAGIQASSLSKAALALARNKKYEEAVTLNKSAMLIADSSGQPFNIFQVYSTMGIIYTLQEKYKEAIPFLEKSIHMLKDADRYDPEIADVYYDLSESYEKTGEYNKALSNYKTSTEINDSVRSKENVRKATELSMNYEFEKKQTVADAIQGKKNAEARFRQLLLMAGLGLTLIVAVGAWVAFRNKQRANALLQQQKTEIENTLAQLKSTQAQLIQSEKMASLGELTAGIAHEIQNPLNFVNNFSEVSVELIAEMETEINNGNTAGVKIIAGDIKRNLEKINHHGRRADTIVKGMLQHSRSSHAVKELININVLANEYLRISYHALRVKDNPFIVAINTELDENVGKINIIQQDIGRVFLNLFTNAFYSFNEKIKQAHSIDTPYKPTISLTTKKLTDSVEIRIKDNGLGIPQKILNKIFQPFFTTKPTGQGTGLGLSLSYDIIKAHGGELKVETKEGEFAEFIIQLPYQNA